MLTVINLMTCKSFLKLINIPLNFLKNYSCLSVKLLEVQTVIRLMIFQIWLVQFYKCCLCDDWEWTAVARCVAAVYIQVQMSIMKVWLWSCLSVWIRDIQGTNIPWFFIIVGLLPVIHLLSTFIGSLSRDSWQNRPTV